MMRTSFRRWVSGITLLALLLMVTAAQAQEEAAAAASDVPAGLETGILFFGVAAVAAVGMIIILSSRRDSEE
jgi:hypothetical protein